MAMVTQYRRRQYRDRRTFAQSDIVAAFYAGAQLFIALFFLGVLLSVLFLGQSFVDAAFSFFGG